MDASPPPTLVVAYTGSGAQRGVNADMGALAIGHQFEVTSEGVVLHEVGVWDQGANGLAGEHPVALFALDQLGAAAQATLLISTTVPAGTTALLEDGFRFAALPEPLPLAPGAYALVAYGLGPDDAYGDGGSPPAPATGVRHGSYSDYQFAELTPPTFPVGGGSSSLASVSFRYTTPADRPLRLLPLGDSITYGNNGTDAGYRAKLLARLTAAGVSTQFVGTSRANPGSLPGEQQFHEGHPGWVISAGAGRDGLTQHLDEWLGPGGVRPDVVLLMIGTNDVNLDYELTDAGNRLDLLIGGILARVPGVRLLVAQITPCKNATVEARAVAYNARVAEVVAARRSAGVPIQLVDMHAAVAPAELADALHPNDLGYQHMADAWFAALMQP